MESTIGIIGLGNMGEAIVRALIASGFKKQRILGAEVKEGARDKARAYGITLAKDAADAVHRSRYVIIAVKPQDAKALASGIAGMIDAKKILISIMAGVTTSGLMSMLEREARIVRVMPNIPVKVREGALGMCANFTPAKGELEDVRSILSPLGLIVDVGEELMDAVTALSASGPAFFLVFLEGMIEAGVKMGLPRDKARSLALQTVKGTVAMLEAEKLHPTLMKEMVTSPGGTTMAGLAVLEEKGLRGTVMRSIEAAMLRARELAKQ